MLKGIENKTIACFVMTTIVLCVAYFFCNARLDYLKTVRLEKEWGRYVMAMNLLPYDERSSMVAEVQRNIQTPILGFEFEGVKPVRAYLIDGQVKDINWVN